MRQHLIRKYEAVARWVISRLEMDGVSDVCRFEIDSQLSCIWFP